MIALPDIGLCPQASLSATTIMAIIAVESRGDPLAIRVNGANVTVPPPQDAEAAAATANRLLAEGYSLDLGLMQVNTSNLSALHVSVRAMFSPCANIAAGSLIFRQDYDAALAARTPGANPVDAALSAYNSGNFVEGIINGYVAQYDTAGGIDRLAARPDVMVSMQGGAARATRFDTLALSQWALASMETGIRTPIRLKPSDFSFSPQSAIALWGIARVSPVTRIALRDYLYAPHRTEADMLPRQDIVYNQDREIVETQRPERIPTDLRDEMHHRTDRLGVEYRRWLRDLGISWGTL
jgi:type IV secretion system protein VirB1